MNARNFVFAACLALPIVAFAQSTPRIDQRQANQAARIEQGEASGALTGREAARLERGQRHVQNVENRTLADGTVTGREAARVEHAQDVQSRRIYRQKHDRQHDLNHDGVTDRPRHR
ncbi:MAG TPA: hypothetical protein PKD04_02795 [Rhodocyclaceae bacterium]|jgi:uncharacterized protein YraI|nr:hypothetical protein [Betaproteobacteria bacterium]HMU99982.1 hypothetical protein [Rhodocyclaceae bacterium]HMV22335.1 hypothetical protein [Rhodocyclaceae bacterium]HMW76345.1 hypothetical protein [Rhodocyclaceae bacterium]HNL22677.1 hypothetical protein [Rhodocyclaceae bacterium]